jgi:hypothetical protein
VIVASKEIPLIAVLQWMRISSRMYPKEIRILPKETVKVLRMIQVWAEAEEVVKVVKARTKAKKRAVM